MDIQDIQKYMQAPGGFHTHTLEKDLGCGPQVIRDVKLYASYLGSSVASWRLVFSKAHTSPSRCFSLVLHSRGEAPNMHINLGSVGVRASAFHVQLYTVTLHLLLCERVQDQGFCQVAAVPPDAVP